MNNQKECTGGCGNYIRSDYSDTVLCAICSEKQIDTNVNVVLDNKHNYIQEHEIFGKEIEPTESSKLFTREEVELLLVSFSDMLSKNLKSNETQAKKALDEWYNQNL